MENKDRQQAKEVLHDLISDAISDAKKELDHKKNYLQTSKQALDAYIELEGLRKKENNIPVIIQTVIAILVVVLSIGGSWFNSQIKTNDFFNDLKYLQENVTKMEKVIDKIDKLTNDHTTELKLINHKIDSLSRQYDKDMRGK